MDNMLISTEFPAETPVVIMGTAISACTSLPINTSTCDLYEHKDTAKIVLPVFYSVILMLGVVGNGLALAVIFKNRKKINSTTLYSTNLVLSDLLFTTSLPTRIAYYALGFDWPFGETFCRLTALIFYINTYAGVNFMTCLSIDRFFAVVHPFRYQKLRRVQHAKGICIFVWFLVLSQTFPLLLQSMSNKEQERITCMEYPNFEKIPNLPLILLAACLIGYLVPLGIILFCYSQISYKLVQTAKANPLSEKSGINKKAINTIIFVIVVFIICFTPYHVAIIQHMIKKLYNQDKTPCSDQQVFQKSLHYTVFLMNFNCCLDPFIYFFACKGYKRRIMKILRRQVSVSVSSAVRSPHEESSRDVGETQMIVLPKSSNGKLLEK
ncbi:PREDICTED: G-protein coupled receptor 183 isoform X1 [Gavialis gangeticus]|uniref:G-protein coupled receptor 183 isoform X1 n=2 Tax=Gavialis gangeticus TaxID=94835 RepID=UPI00092FCA12|nr:PREDICTED: G-protein coupled receptor 183 isoform X1 [Gavialis gangeticus]XP_019379816.1 PREDICTED: G-protein coupled receptor 183 isoform X1 [Gavialis gangeticus]